MYPVKNDSLQFNKNGGGRGIRTPAGFDSPVGFQDRSLQPNLGIPPCQQNIIYHVQKTKSI